MNYEQAEQYSKLVPWKTEVCFSGPECWCRIIVPKDPIYYSHPESMDVKREFVVVDSGALDVDTAEYIVELHNKYIKSIVQDLN